jgi:hypothetical protein
MIIFCNFQKGGRTPWEMFDSGGAGGQNGWGSGGSFSGVPAEAGTRSEWPTCGAALRRLRIEEEQPTLPSEAVTLPMIAPLRSLENSEDKITASIEAFSFS